MTGSGAYALLAVPFFAAVAVVAVAAGIVAARRARARARARRAASGRRIALVTGLVAGAALLVMTIVFDNVIVTLRIVAYDPALISGAKIGAIPVEDLAYSIAAIVLLPSLWVLFDRTGPRGPAVSRPAPDPTTAPPEDTP